MYIKDIDDDNNNNNNNNKNNNSNNNNNNNNALSESNIISLEFVAPSSPSQKAKR